VDGHGGQSVPGRSAQLSAGGGQTRRGLAVSAAANYAALAVAAAAALVVNGVIAWFYTVEAVGVFNQVFAIYIVASQLAAAGVHLAALSLSGGSAEAIGARTEVLASGIAAVLLTSVCCAIALFGLSSLVARVLGSDGVAPGLRVVALALPVFAINKCFQSAFTAAGRMQAVALLQGLRAIGLLVATLVCSLAGVSGSMLPIVFLAAELGVLVAAAVLWRREAGVPTPARVRPDRVREMLRFGAVSLVGSTLQELNIRIDLLVIGMLLEDRDVGIYSFAGLAAEGLLSAIAVIRNLSVPGLAAALRDPDHATLASLVGAVYRWTYAGVFLLAVIGVAGLWGFLRLGYGAQSVYLQAVPLLVILAGGIVAVAGVLAFDYVFVVAGRPGLHSLVVAASVVANTLLNVLLVPRFGLAGAAWATVMATALYALVIVVVARVGLGVRLFPGLTR
jgi:O-antigen/teichoic acid export membrane protein